MSLEESRLSSYELTDDGCGLLREGFVQVCDVRENVEDIIVHNQHNSCSELDLYALPHLTKLIHVGRKAN
jgi:hypothetical protein